MPSRAMDNGPSVQPITKTNPDPSIATNEALERAVKAERDYVDGQISILVERLGGIDKATELLQVSQDRLPEHVAKVVGHLKELHAEKFDSVQKQFTERDTRAEGESAANTIRVDAAFAAADKAADERNKSSVLAIDKSEKATTETIKTNQELTSAAIATLTKSLDEVKLQVSRIESTKQGSKEVLSGVQILFATAIAAGGLVAAIYLASQP